MEQVCGVLAMTLPGMMWGIFVLITVHHLILIIARIFFWRQVKNQLMILMAALVQQRNILVLTLVKQRQNFAWVWIAMGIIVICLLIKKKPKANNKNANFPTQFCSGSKSEKVAVGEFLINKICMILQSITVLLINSTY